MLVRPVLRAARRGSIVPMLAVCAVALFSFVALAIDLGMLMVARTESQNAADAAALSAARTLDNRVPPFTSPDAYDNKKAAADLIARGLVQENIFLNARYAAARVQRVRIGIYDYDAAVGSFVASYPNTKPSGKSWTAAEVVVNADQPTNFAKVFGVSSMPMSSRAVAAHRPRDIAVVLDMSGSMQFSSTTHWEPGTAGSFDIVQGLLNPDPVYPKFGHYARFNTYQTTAPSKALATGGSGTRPNPFRLTVPFLAGTGEVFSPNNLTMETPNGPPVIRDFLFDPANLGNASIPVSAVSNPSNLRNAFHRWRRYTNPNGTFRYDPPATSAGDPTNYVAPTYNWSGYNANDATNTNGPTPAPDFFDRQIDSAGVSYVGDRYPRKGGFVYAADVSWDPATTLGAARNAVELLFPGSASPSPVARAVPASRPALRNGNRTEGGLSWDQFYDDAWERNGYDLNVAGYINSSTNTANGTGPRASAPLRTPGFNGFSMGPGYYGKTFFIWPPDPRWGNPNGGAPNGGQVRPDLVNTQPTKDVSGNWICDWRRRFFVRGNSADTGSPTTFLAFDPAIDNDPSAPGNQSINQALMRTGVGYTLRDGSSGGTRNYKLNYRAVLAWLKSGPQTLPPNLRAGRVLYYASIPDNIDNWATDLDQRFWREYIDFVMGYNGNTPNNDPRFSLAGVEMMAWPENAIISIGNTSSFDPDATGPMPANPVPYMNYTDNPSRPRMHMWFGPATMLAFLSTRAPLRNWLPGNSHEAQGWQLKAGVQSGIEDIRNNHPNDRVGIAFFAHANYNTPRVAMSQDWQTLKNSLFFPKSLLPQLAAGSGSAELRAYNTGFGSALLGNLPNANGGTDPNTGFALAYNLLSSSPTVNADPNQRGRRGAVKIVLFETDGVPNAYQNFSYSGGANASYTFGGTGAFVANGDPGVMQQSYDIVAQIVAPVSAGGYSLPSAPARVYPIAFGDLFSSTSSFRPQAMGFLQNVAQRGNTAKNASDPLPTEQIITGSSQDRIDKLRTSFERILQSGVQVTLIE